MEWRQINGEKAGKRVKNIAALPVRAPPPTLADCTVHRDGALIAAHYAAMRSVLHVIAAAALLSAGAGRNQQTADHATSHCCRLS